MTPNEEKTLLETRLRNLKRRKAKLLQHASQLAESGMSTDHINLLQGRKVSGVAHESYIRIKPETLREEYINALPYLVIEETNRYKTELEQLQEEKKEWSNILERLERLEKDMPTWDEFIEK